MKMPQPRIHESAAQRQAAYRQRIAQAQAAQQQDRGLPPLPAVSSIPGWTRWRGLIQRAHHALQLTTTEMTQYFEARSETWQDSERGDDFQERLDALQEILDELEAFGAEHDVALKATA